MIVDETDESKEKIIVTAQDLTDIEKLEKAKAQNKVTTVYFASVAHDLRSPINTILGLNSQIALLGGENIKKLL